MTDFKPTLIVAISGGGLVPARILRTMIKVRGLLNAVSVWCHMAPLA